jgi:hypothetical protein
VSAADTDAKSNQSDWSSEFAAFAHVEEQGDAVIVKIVLVYSITAKLAMMYSFNWAIFVVFYCSGSGNQVNIIEGLTTT